MQNVQQTNSEQISRLAVLVDRLAEALEQAMLEYNRGVAQGGIGTLELGEIGGRVREIRSELQSLQRGP
jgi:exonuclease VII small subunit